MEKRERTSNQRFSVLNYSGKYSRYFLSVLLVFFLLYYGKSRGADLLSAGDFRIGNTSAQTGRDCGVLLTDGFYSTSVSTLELDIRALETSSAINSIKFASFEFKKDTRKMNSTMVLIAGRCAKTCPG